MMKSAKYTILSCYVGYITQAIVNNFIPLLFIFLMNNYGISLKTITMITTINFLVQLITDVACIKVVDKIGYRISIIIAHLLCASGLILLTILPELISPMIGILISVIIYAIGGGLIEVLISPIMDACPTDNKEAQMSLLHSFYCWGHVGVILISTLYFKFIGIEYWKVLSILWSLIPLLNALCFIFVPIYDSSREHTQNANQLFNINLFWIFVLLMIMSGSSEQAMSQWASAFAESSLGVSKSIGDLFGPGLFALCMGLSRALYGKYADKISLIKAMKYSALLCIISYLCASLSHNSLLGFIGCLLCGFSVGVFWPGTFSLALEKHLNGTALFALLALAGDVGCSLGPTSVGLISSIFNDNLKSGLLCATLFPFIIWIICTTIKQKE